MPSIDEILIALPPVPDQSVRPRIRELAQKLGSKLVVLDDDPTGTQTVYDIPVLTEWDQASLAEEFRNDLACFYILTNSRSLTPDQTTSLHQEIARNLKAAAKSTHRKYTIVSRSDSTLRGHFPLETDVLAEECGPYDATFVLPFFAAGGRVTVDDTHYVVEDGVYTPAANTPFAKDAVFGYENSNLRRWIAEKTQGRVSDEEVESISIEILRGPLESITSALLALPKNAYVAVNALVPSDVEAFALATLQSEGQGRRFLYRSAASLVAARLGLEPRPLWQPDKITTSTGGIVVVGSYVPKTSQQLDHLLNSGATEALELNVSELLTDQRESVIAASVTQLHGWLSEGKNVTVYTSRTLITGDSAAENLHIGNTVSSALVEIVQKLSVTPRFLIAKGGITSSDIATKGLNVLKATVLGQILPGVPAWELGNETRFPGVPYIVFPGNVGTPESLLDAVRILSPVS